MMRSLKAHHELRKNNWKHVSKSFEKLKAHDEFVKKLTMGYLQGHHYNAKKLIIRSLKSSRTRMLKAHHKIVLHVGMTGCT